MEPLFSSSTAPTSETSLNPQPSAIDARLLFDAPNQTDTMASITTKKENLGKEDHALNRKPKRPLSAYNIFFHTERQNILKCTPTRAEGKPRRSHGKIGFSELARHIGAKWKTLKTEEREPYARIAAQDKERYDKEMEVWKKENKNSLVKHPTSTITVETDLTSSIPILVPSGSWDSSGGSRDSRTGDTTITLFAAVRELGRSAAMTLPTMPQSLHQHQLQMFQDQAQYWHHHHHQQLLLQPHHPQENVYDDTPFELHHNIEHRTSLLDVSELAKELDHDDIDMLVELFRGYGAASNF